MQMQTQVSIGCTILRHVERMTDFLLEHLFFETRDLSRWPGPIRYIFMSRMYVFQIYVLQVSIL
jgi:hypothetical protein